MKQFIPNKVIEGNVTATAILKLYHIYGKVPSVDELIFESNINKVLETAIKHYNTNDKPYYDALIKQYPKPEDIKD